jgi:lipid-A-disaccharide synthase
VDGDGPLVELRPGSRRRDVRRQTRLVLDAAREAARRVPSTRFFVRLASEKARTAFEAAAASSGGIPAGVEIVVGGASRAEPREPIAAALTTSGTSTAELAVAAVPMVVFYRLPMLLRLVRRAYLATPWFAMANVLAGRDVVVERLVGPGDGASLGADLAALLSDRARWTATRAALMEVRARVAHPDVADRAARAILDAGPASA